MQVRPRWGWDEDEDEDWGWDEDDEDDGDDDDDDDHVCDTEKVSSIKPAVFEPIKIHQSCHS